MSTRERRMAARAHQRAAAFIRCQLLGDHEAMNIVLTDAGETTTEKLGFVTALAAIASSMAVTALGREQALDHLQSLAEKSALLSSADDIDRYFD